MKKLILILASITAFAQGQNQNPPPPPALASGEVIRVIEIKQADANEIYYTLTRVFPGISVNNRMLIVRGPESVVGTIEDAIKKLDVPPAPRPEARPAANVELVVYLLYGSSQEDATAKVPGDLDASIRQLRAVFPYKSYRIMDTQVMRARDGQPTQNSGNLPNGNSTFALSFTPRVSAGAAPRTVRLERFVMEVQLSNKASGIMGEHARIATDLDGREGQKIVVGKANVTGTDDAIILVVTPRVIE